MGKPHGLEMVFECLQPYFMLSLAWAKSMHMELDSGSNLGYVKPPAGAGPGFQKG